jgi:hypothetical protein
LNNKLLTLPDPVWTVITNLYKTQVPSHYPDDRLPANRSGPSKIYFFSGGNSWNHVKGDWHQSRVREEIGTPEGLASGPRSAGIICILVCVRVSVSSEEERRIKKNEIRAMRTPQTRAARLP